MAERLYEGVDVIDRGPQVGPTRNPATRRKPGWSSLAGSPLVARSSFREFEEQPGGNPPPPVTIEQADTFATPSVTVSLLFGASAEELLAGFTTVWMHGAHDRSTAQALSVAIRRASDIDDADVMVDFSDASSIDINVVRAILSSKLSLQQRSLLLCVRRPSSCVRRFAETNGFGWLFAQGPDR